MYIYIQCISFNHCAPQFIFTENFHLVYLKWMKSMRAKKRQNRAKEMTTTMKKYTAIAFYAMLTFFLLHSGILCVFKILCSFVARYIHFMFMCFRFYFHLITSFLYFLLFLFLFFWSDERLLSFHSFFKFNLLQHVWCDTATLCLFYRSMCVCVCVICFVYIHTYTCVFGGCDKKRDMSSSIFDVTITEWCHTYYHT